VPTTLSFVLRQGGTVCVLFFLTRQPAGRQAVLASWNFCCSMSQPSPQSLCRFHALHYGCWKLHQCGLMHLLPDSSRPRCSHTKHTSKDHVSCRVSMPTGDDQLCRRQPRAAHSLRERCSFTASLCWRSPCSHSPSCQSPQMASSPAGRAARTRASMATSWMTG